MYVVLTFDALLPTGASYYASGLLGLNRSDTQSPLKQLGENDLSEKI